MKITHLGTLAVLTAALAEPALAATRRCPTQIWLAPRVAGTLQNSLGVVTVNGYLGNGTGATPGSFISCSYPTFGSGGLSQVVASARKLSNGQCNPSPFIILEAPGQQNGGWGGQIPPHVDQILNDPGDFCRYLLSVPGGRTLRVNHLNDNSYNAFKNTVPVATYCNAASAAECR
jgi:hypothetical protein